MCGRDTPHTYASSPYRVNLPLGTIVVPAGGGAGALCFARTLWSPPIRCRLVDGRANSSLASAYEGRRHGSRCRTSRFPSVARLSAQVKSLTEGADGDTGEALAD
jgi:hypothetical protein